MRTEEHPIGFIVLIVGVNNMTKQLELFEEKLKQLTELCKVYDKETHGDLTSYLDREDKR
jgi:hypothetical protein